MRLRYRWTSNYSWKGRNERRIILISDDDKKKKDGGGIKNDDDEFLFSPSMKEEGDACLQNLCVVDADEL
eukprot:CAMPEP_0194154568 /NCGR_PEP_ID=MMETSP0152-20130528/61207_1 /TAXON_ID=1049557 /ORGANISM="Thalassiothrix antarctica, Strain L6-D1" /LENGTH=69 /DNA_ID=CAMNT_0038860767 /DNA_START=149 /DNA_END=354 /DNA_ORIENTATION=+